MAHKHATTLQAALRAAAGVPADAVVVPGPDDTVELRASDPEPLCGHTAGWVRRVLEVLDHAGVRPLLVIA